MARKRSQRINRRNRHQSPINEFDRQNRLLFLLRLGFGVVAILFCVGWVVITNSPTADGLTRNQQRRIATIVDNHYDPTVRSSADYRRLFASITQTPTDPSLTPVHIFKNGLWHCSGTALTFSATREVVLTSIHGFRRGLDDGYFSYRKLIPFDPTLRDLASVQAAPHWQKYFGREPDVALSIAGPRQLIKGITDLTSVNPNAKSSIRLDALAKDEEKWVVSLLTGKRYRCLLVGYDTVSGKAHHLIFANHSLGGESGSGFVVEGWPGSIVVLGGSVELDDKSRAALPLDYRFAKMSSGYVMTYKIDPHGVHLSPIGSTYELDR